MELEQHKELYVPQMPLKFDKTDKLLIYSTEHLSESRRMFRIALAGPMVVMYCAMRAI